VFQFSIRDTHSKTALEDAAATSQLNSVQPRLSPYAGRRAEAGRRTAAWLVPASQWRLDARALAFAALRLPGAATLMRPLVKVMRGSVITGDE
jgi:hypothetical protein